MWHLAEDTISHKEIDALADWLKTHPRLTQGTLVKEFERTWSDWLGVEESVFVSSGTTANFALIAAIAHTLGRQPRVGVSAVTWSTNVTPSMFLNQPIVVFDVDPRTLGIDADQAVDAIRNKAIDVLFVTHLLGFDSLTEEILGAAQDAGVIILEDCCEAHGARHAGMKVGSVGLAGTFSFYFGHHMSTVEGGMISTYDRDLADRLRLIRAHGLSRESARAEEHAANHPEIDPRFLFMIPGLNFRSSELNAFLGIRQLELLDSRVEMRNQNLAYFLENLPDGYWKDFRTEGVSSFALPIILNDPTFLPRVRDELGKLEIENRPVVAGNLLRQPFFADYPHQVYGGTTPVADRIHDGGLYVGNGHHVSPSMIDPLLAALGSALE